jgi:hypothetical protein
MANPATTTGATAAVNSTLPDVVDGDTMVAFIVSSSASATIDDPAGWTRRQATETAADFTSFAWTRKWVSGDTAPAWTLSVAANWSCDIIAKPGDYDNSAQSVIAASNSTTNTVTPVADNCLVISQAAVDATGLARTWTCDKGTEVLDQMDTEQHRQIVTEQLVGGAGVAQSYVHTVTGSAQDVAGIIVTLVVTGPPPDYTGYLDLQNDDEFLTEQGTDRITLEAGAPAGGTTPSSLPLRRRNPQLTYR